MQRIAIGTLTLVAACLGLSVDALSSPAPASNRGMGMSAAPATGTTTLSSNPATRTAQTTTTPTQAPVRGPAKTGQPGQDCESLGNQPGRSMSAPGSAFNPDGKAGSVYAGTQPQNSGNTASVSQYDVACARPTH
jgi:hypothetical protein